MAKDAERTGCLFRCQVEWAMWANMNALYAAVLLFIGGVVAATVEIISLDPAISIPVHRYGAVSRWFIIAISMIIFFCEYPRSARRNRGKNVERPGQQYIAPLLKLTGFVGRNYIFRFMLYLSAIIPCLFVLSSIIGAICLSFACICYFVAALNGEEWIAPSVAWGPGAVSKSDQEQTAGHTLPEAPTHPPPRPPPQFNKEDISQAPSELPPRYRPG